MLFVLIGDLPVRRIDDLCNAFRKDVVVPSMDREDALNNAPARHDTEFMLPKIVEDA